MKYAYYEFVPNEEEKRLRLQQLNELAKADPDCYSAYMEIASRYNAPLMELRAMKALKAAIRKGKVDMIVIPSFANLYMEQVRAHDLLLDFLNKGVCIAIGEPQNILSKQDIYDEYDIAQEECVENVLTIPMNAGKKCVVHHSRNDTYLRLVEDCVGESLTLCGVKMLYSDAVKRYQARGFYFYRSDVKSWYHVDANIAAMMIESYEKFASSDIFY